MSLQLLSVLLFLAQAITTTSGGDLVNDCPPSRCSQSGPEIRLPLSLNSAPPYCRLFSGLNLSCSDNHTLFFHSPSPSPSPSPSGGGGSSNVVAVAAVDYHRGMIKLIRPWATCPWQTNSTNDDSDPKDDDFCPSLERYHYPEDGYSLIKIFYTLTKCTAELASSIIGNKSIAGPISCLSGTAGSSDRYFVYAVDSDNLPIDGLPSYCSVISRGTAGCADHSNPNRTFREDMEEFSRTVTWDYDDNNCTLCIFRRESCGYNKATNQTFCISNNQDDHHGDSKGPHVALISGLCIAAFIILVSLSVAYYIYRKFNKENLTRLKVEKFLAMYKSTNPTRYTYPSIKKVTNNFKHKLGQGGYGSVYKGEILNGIPVAVKMLEISRTGDEFINEVITMGRIHHVNVVRLLGYCPEGARRALIYEFMPNQSLDRFIFHREDRKTLSKFSMEKLQEIVLGTARGIEYLHQGCDQRILHFDIKPHNILLDRDFNPKVSDFGLAKLCSRDESAITMTAARGTKGYIAPEVYSRNFGTVSHKSDVYSFGMLVLEMVSGRRNVDPSIDNQGDAYLPEWSYNLLIQQQEEGSDVLEMVDCDSEIARKLIIVALWCIQWSPADRPSMTRVVQMLMGNSDSLQIPPEPFVSSSDIQHDAITPIPLNN